MRPRRSTKCRDPCLKYTLEEHRWILSGDDEVKNGQRSDSVNNKTGDDGNHVETKLLCSSCQILDEQDLASYETHDAERRIPTYQQPTPVTTIHYFLIIYLNKSLKVRLLISDVEASTSTLGRRSTI